MAKLEVSFNITNYKWNNNTKNQKVTVWQKYCSWKWRMANLWKAEFGLKKSLQKERDKLDWTTLMHRGPKQIILGSIFFQWLFISLGFR